MNDQTLLDVKSTLQQIGQIFFLKQALQEHVLEAAKDEVHLPAGQH